MSGFILNLMALGFGALSWAAAERTVGVTTPAGDKIEIAVSEIRSAYMKSLKVPYAGDVIPNPDGSTTLLNPYLPYQGRAIRFGGPSLGVCKKYGFSQVVSASATSYRDFGAWLDEKGIVQALSQFQLWEVVNCR